jgi:hypothetical protein
MISQDYSTIGNWNPVKQILFETSFIPVQPEFTATSDNSFKKILVDFEPNQSGLEDYRTVLQYFPSGQYRLVDITGTNPVYQVDLTVKWIDIDGVEYFVRIPENQVFSAKMIFAKRNIYKSANLIYE